MLRSRASSAFTRVFHAVWRGVSKQEARPHPSRRALARPPQDEGEHHHHFNKEIRMLIVLILAAIAITLYYCLALPRLRRLPWWDAVVAEVRAVLERACVRLRAFCGNSKTIAVAYAAELLGVLDEAKVLDWSALLGAESAGRASW
jgi:hypothetical protein